MRPIFKQAWHIFKQAWHIFRKDVRHLWIEIAMMSALCAALLWSPPVLPLDLRNATLFLLVFPWTTLYQAAVFFVIARLIHAEAIPGDRQFWVTRPYRWQSLLLAKALFIALFTHLPLAIYHVAMLVRGGFPVGANIPDLLVVQLLQALRVSIPAAALAALTSSVTWFGVTALIGVATIGLYNRIVPSLGDVEWVRDAATIIAFTILILPVFVWQYRNRATRWSRGWSVAVLAAGALIYPFVPWQLVFAAQFSPSPNIQLKFAADPSNKRLLQLESTARQAEVDVPITVAGAPDLSLFRADALSITVQPPSGPAFTASPEFSSRLGPYPKDSTMLYFWLTRLDRSLIDGGPITLRGTLYYTLFGNLRDVTLKAGEATLVAKDYRCVGGVIDQRLGPRPTNCASPFRPMFRVVDNVYNSEIPPTALVSYSPLPVGFNITPVRVQGSAMGPELPERTIRIKEPVAHLRQDFEIPNVNLREFSEPRRAQ